MAKIDLTPSQLEIVLWALNECIFGDGNSYDNKIKRIIKRIQEQQK